MTARCVPNNGTVWDVDHVCVKWFTQLFCTPISFTSFLCSSLQFPTTHMQTRLQYKKFLVFLSLVRVVKLVSFFSIYLNIFLVLIKGFPWVWLLATFMLLCSSGLFAMFIDPLCMTRAFKFFPFGLLLCLPCPVFCFSSYALDSSMPIREHELKIYIKKLPQERNSISSFNIKTH